MPSVGAAVVSSAADDHEKRGRRRRRGPCDAPGERRGPPRIARGAGLSDGERRPREDRRGDGEGPRREHGGDATRHEESRRDHGRETDAATHDRDDRGLAHGEGRELCGREAARAQERSLAAPRRAEQPRELQHREPGEHGGEGDRNRSDGARRSGARRDVVHHFGKSPGDDAPRNRGIARTERLGKGGKARGDQRRRLDVERLPGGGEPPRTVAVALGQGIRHRHRVAEQAREDGGCRGILRRGIRAPARRDEHPAARLVGRGDGVAHRAARHDGGCRGQPAHECHARRDRQRDQRTEAEAGPQPGGEQRGGAVAHVWRGRRVRTRASSARRCRSPPGRSRRRRRAPRSPRRRSHRRA